MKCFFGTITAVLKHDGVVEGGTGTLHEEENLLRSKDLDLFYGQNSRAAKLAYLLIYPLKSV